MNRLGGKPLRCQQGQALAEYAVMLGVLLFFLIFAETVGINANRLLQWVANVFH